MEKPLGEILVLFPPESRLSGIQRKLAREEKYIYRKTFTITEDFNKDHVLLHFGVVDQILKYG